LSSGRRAAIPATICRAARSASIETSGKLAPRENQVNSCFRRPANSARTCEPGKRGDLGTGLAQPGGGAIQLGTVSRAQDQTAAALGQFGSEQQPWAAGHPGDYCHLVGEVVLWMKSAVCRRSADGGSGGDNREPHVLPPASVWPSPLRDGAGNG
jgi:hypothetical protein